MDASPLPRNRPQQFVLPCPSPCVKQCGIDETLRCSGCLRTGLEVAAWLTMSDDERWDLLMEVVLRSTSSMPAQQEKL